jgi:hypothetical protein
LVVIAACGRVCARAAGGVGEGRAEGADGLDGCLVLERVEQSRHAVRRVARGVERGADDEREQLGKGLVGREVGTHDDGDGRGEGDELEDAG